MPTLRRSNPAAPAQGYALRPTNPDALSQVSTEKLLLVLRRRVIAPRNRRRNTWDGRLDPHGHWPEQGWQHRRYLAARSGQADPNDKE